MQVETMEQFKARGGTIQNVDIKQGYTMPNEMKGCDSMTRKDWAKFRENKAKYYRGKYDEFYKI